MVRSSILRKKEIQKSMFFMSSPTMADYIVASTYYEVACGGRTNCFCSFSTCTKTPRVDFEYFKCRRSLPLTITTRISRIKVCDPMHHQPFLSAFNSSTCRQIATYHILVLEETIEITWPLKCGVSAYQNTNSNLNKKEKRKRLCYNGNDIKANGKVKHNTHNEQIGRTSLHFVHY